MISFRWLCLSCFVAVACAGCGSDEGKPEPQTQFLLDDVVSDKQEVQESLWFEDKTEAFGISHVYQSRQTPEFLFPEIVGGGGAFIDFDNDGDLDLFLPQSSKWNDASSDVAKGNLFYENRDGVFHEVDAGLASHISGYWMGVAVADFDNDGYLDLYLTAVGKNALLRNSGDGTFSDVTQKAGVGDEAWGTSAAFFDADNDGDQDLYVCNYVTWSRETDRECFSRDGTVDYCSPKSYHSPSVDVFYRNNGDGTFSDATEESGISTATGNGMGLVVLDVDRDQDLDVYVANDMTENLLWINDGQGHFSNHSSMAGCAVDRGGVSKAGMGVCVADFDSDQTFDILVCNMVGQSDSLYLNNNGQFSDGTIREGLGLHSRPYTRFGIGAHDFDNDRDMDLFIANGRVIRGRANEDVSDPYAEKNLLLEKTSDGYREVGGFVEGEKRSQVTSRAAVFGDINNDGAVDVVVVNRDQPTQVLINRQKEGNWLGVDVRTGDGHTAVGAELRIKVGTQQLSRLVGPAYSYLASNDPRALFGLGDHDQEVEVEVRWTSGLTETYGPFSLNQYIQIRGRDLAENNTTPAAVD